MLFFSHFVKMENMGFQIISFFVIFQFLEESQQQQQQQKLQNVKKCHRKTRLGP